MLDIDWIRQSRGDPGMSLSECLEEQDRVGPNALFDTRFYRAAYGSNIPHRMTCLEHFCRQTKEQPRDPNPFFSVRQWHEIAAESFPHLGFGGFVRGLGTEARFAREELQRFKNGMLQTGDFVLGSGPAPGQEICVFAHYDERNEVQPYVLDYLDALLEHGVCISFVSSCEALVPGAHESLKGRVWRLACTRNRGRDWGLYHIGVRLLEKEFPGHPIILVNDSAVGTMNSLNPLFEAARSDGAEITGAVDSWVHDWHLQSFFLYCNCQAVKSAAWREFWNGFRPLNEKWFVINAHEVGFSRFMTARGIRMKAVWEYNHILRTAAMNTASTWRDDFIRRQGKTNPSVEFWDLLLEKGFPFLKRELMSPPPGGICSGNLRHLCNVISNLSYALKRTELSIADHRPRTEKLLLRFTKEQRILEIGPSYNPLISRSEGWNCYSLDHGSAEELRVKYGKDPVADYGRRIQEVDFVWRSGPMESAIPAEQMGTFDGVLASHVIEHTPDLVGFFESVGKILGPNGYLSLAVPDKRFCFDYFQPVTMTGEVLAAYHEKRNGHTKKTAFHSAAYAIRINGNKTVAREPARSHTLFHPRLDPVFDLFQAHDPSADAPYIDWHNWFFTPSSFRLICLELRMLGLTDFQEVEFFDTIGHEFIVILQRGGKPPEGTMETGRLRLLKKIVLELGDQAKLMLDGMSSAEIAGLREL
jgi:SAM-dependent methyltransferase